MFFSTPQTLNSLRPYFYFAIMLLNPFEETLSQIHIHDIKTITRGYHNSESEYIT